MAATKSAVNDMSVDDAGDLLRWWTPDEEPLVAYGFCSACGSSLFWRCTLRLESMAIAAGTLDTPTGLSTNLAIFVADASDYHRLDPDLPSRPYDWVSSDI